MHNAGHVQDQKVLLLYVVDMVHVTEVELLVVLESVLVHPLTTTAMHVVHVRQEDTVAAAMNVPKIAMVTSAPIVVHVMVMVHFQVQVVVIVYPVQLVPNVNYA